MTIGERVKQRRQELGLTVDEIAERLRKNRATVYRYESNYIENLPSAILEPLAEILQTTPAYLIGWEEENNQNLEVETASDHNFEQILALIDDLDVERLVELMSRITETIQKKVSGKE